MELRGGPIEGLERARCEPSLITHEAVRRKESFTPIGKEKTLCRWLAYSGSPILLEELLYKPDHSLIDQSLHARLGVETTNGDGFGVGWYGANTETPAVFHAHIRASTGTAVQQTNCHPFRHGRWLWVHNGLVHDFERVKRELALAVDDSLY